MRVELPAVRDQVGAARRAARERPRRNGQRGVPEKIEGVRQASHHGAGGEHVVVAELRVGIDLEIRIGNVAPADERDRIVDDHQLVVHPVVEPPRLEQELEGAHRQQMAAIGERVEDADLDVRVSAERDQTLVAVERVAVVDQHAHPHPAVGCAQQRGGEQLPRRVLPKDEIFEIQRVLGRIDHLRAGEKAVDADRQQAKSGLPGMRARRGVECNAELRRRRGWQRGGRQLRIIRARRQRRASGRQHGGANHGRRAQRRCAWHGSSGGRGAASRAARSCDPRCLVAAGLPFPRAPGAPGRCPAPDGFPWAQPWPGFARDAQALRRGSAARRRPHAKPGLRALAAAFSARAAAVAACAPGPWLLARALRGLGRLRGAPDLRLRGLSLARNLRLTRWPLLRRLRMRLRPPRARFAPGGAPRRCASARW